MLDSVDRFPFPSAAGRVEVTVLDVRMRESRPTGIARNESGVLDRKDIFWLTKRSILRPRKRRDSGGSEGPSRTSLSGFVSRVSPLVQDPISKLRLQPDSRRKAGG